MKATKAALLIGALLISSQASATEVNGNSLQNALNNITYGSSDQTVDADFMDVNDDQIGSDQIWALTSTSISANRLMFELAGYRNSNRFGIYDIYDATNRLEIFSGPASGGAPAVVLGFGNTFAVVSGTSATSIPTFTGAATFQTGAFGYYLQGPGGIFYSQNSLNADGADQMVAFRGNDELYVNASGYGSGLFSSGEYILAWEDLPASNGDNDFNDFVVMVESVTPVPAPGALALFGLALAGMGFARRRA